MLLENEPLVDGEISREGLIGENSKHAKDVSLISSTKNGILKSLESDKSLVVNGALFNEVDINETSGGTGTEEVESHKELVGLLHSFIHQQGIFLPTFMPSGQSDIEPAFIKVADSNWTSLFDSYF